jgi:GNAT superfamily N-acetyltransferase
MRIRDAVPEDMPAASGPIQLAQIADALPDEFETLRMEARAEGYNFIERLAADWSSGATRFDRTGEGLLAAYIGDELAAVGGLTVDPAIPAALRMRRFYVRERYRRSGVGRRLATALLKQASQAGRSVTVNAGPGSAAFWEALGLSQTSATATRIYSRGLRARWSSGAAK